MYNNISVNDARNLPIALIVGAGPAGLAAANLFQLYQQKFCLIDQRTSPSDLSKATGIHRNTLKLFDKLNLTKEFVERSIELNGNNIYVEGQIIQRIIFEQGKNLNDKNISIDQSIAEDILLENLTSTHGDIQWGKRLISFEQDENSIIATIQDIATGAINSISAQFLIASDGAKSTVREKMSISFEGTTTPETSFTFDAKVISPFHTSEMAMFTKGLDRLVVVPLPQNRHKFSGKVSDIWLQSHETKNPENLASIVLDRSDIKIDPKTITGISFYHTASRIASSIRERRVFLIGDAAHVFFPAGGYGLNVAIENAFSLVWRVVLIQRKHFNSEAILSSFSTEMLENALQIQADSDQKKADSSKTTCSTTSTKETQVYHQRKNTSSFVRIDTLLPLQEFERISHLIHQHSGFSVVINTNSAKTIEESFEFAKQMEIASGFFFQIIQLIAEENSLIPSEFLCLIRPDNFAKILPINFNTYDTIQKSLGSSDNVPGLM